MSRELLQQAIDALEIAVDMSYSELFSDRFNAVITALRAALAAPQPEPVARVYDLDILTRDRVLRECGPVNNAPLYLHPPAAPSVPAWIACSERMPDADIEVLAFIGPEMYLAEYEPDGWYDTHTCAPLNGITHWMPLPEAPSGEGSR